MRGQRGLTLVETLITLIILVVGVLTSVSVLGTSSKATMIGQRKEVLVSFAQRELERVRPLPYAKVGLTTAPRPGAPALLPPAAGEQLVLGGVIEPGPESFAVQGITGRVYRFVTWRRQSCPAVKGKVADQVSATSGIPASDVAAALSDLCPGSRHTKRVTVVLVPDALSNGDGPSKPMALSTLVVDPESSVYASDSYDGLKVDSSQLVQTAQTGNAPDPNTIYENVTQQTLYLYDTPCSSSTRVAPVASHPTRDTSSADNACGSSPSRPDLMGVAPIPSGSGVVEFDYSNEILRRTPRGLALTRDKEAGACSNAWRYPVSQTTLRKSSIHTWATPTATAAAETAPTGGRGVITMYTERAGLLASAGRLCVVLWKKTTGVSAGTVLGAVDYELPDWPAAASQISVAFDVAHTTLNPGDRLMLTLRTHPDSGDDLILHHDHPSYPSNVMVAMRTGKEFR